MMNKNNNLKKNELMKNQQYLFYQIRKTHRLFLGELLALLLFSLMFGIFLVPFITFRIDEFYIVPRVLIAFNFAFFIIIQVIRICPYIRDAGYYLKNLRIILVDSHFILNLEKTYNLFNVLTHILMHYLFLLLKTKNQRKKSELNLLT